VLGAAGARDDDVDVEVLQLREAAEEQAVGLGVARQGLGVGDDDLLDAAGGDREDAGAEGVAGVLLEQGGVLAAVQEVLVGRRAACSSTTSASCQRSPISMAKREMAAPVGRLISKRPSIWRSSGLRNTI
jgi:hypothetical protein